MACSSMILIVRVTCVPTSDETGEEEQFLTT